MTIDVTNKVFLKNVETTREDDPYLMYTPSSSIGRTCTSV